MFKCVFIKLNLLNKVIGSLNDNFLETLFVEAIKITVNFDLLRIKLILYFDNCIYQFSNIRSIASQGNLMLG